MRVGVPVTPIEVFFMMLAASFYLAEEALFQFEKSPFLYPQVWQSVRK